MLTNKVIGVLQGINKKEAGNTKTSEKPLGN